MRRAGCLRTEGAEEVEVEGRVGRVGSRGRAEVLHCTALTVDRCEEVSIRLTFANVL